MKTSTLGDLLEIADSGTWGEEGTPVDGFPVLRSSNIQDGRLHLSDLAWRVIPENDLQRSRLIQGDIIVTKSSGSSDLIGKCCIFDMDSVAPYYFSNFTLRLRAKPDVCDYRWLFYWLTSQRGRAILAALNTTTTGLRNLSVPRYLAQEIPSCSLAQQQRRADIMEKADTIRRKRQEAMALTGQLLRSTFVEMFGDIPAHRSPWKWGSAREHVEMSSGKGAKEVLSGDPTAYPVYGGNGINGWATSPLYSEPIIVVGRVGQQCGIVHIVDEPCWVTDNAIVIRTINTDVIDPIYLGESLQAAPIRDMVSRLDLPFINQDMLRDQPIPIPPISLQRKFTAFRQALLRSQRAQLNARAEADNLFNALVQRAFNGQL